MPKKIFSFVRPEFIISIILVIFITGVYWQIKDFDFICYDDGAYIVNNKNVHNGLTFDNIIWAFTTIHAANWHPLTWLSHMMDVQIYGMNPGGHHLTNLLFHIANTLLLFIVFRKITDRVWESAFVAALFALHPLHVQSVAWVSERKDVLSAFFWFATMWFYARYAERPTVAKYILVLISFILGLMSKPMLVTLPFVLILIDFWPLDRFGFFQNKNQGAYNLISKNLHLLWEKIPLFIITTLSILITYYAQNHAGNIRSFDIIPIQVRLANAIVSYMGYLFKMLYPANLSIHYPYQGYEIQFFKLINATLLFLMIFLLAFKLVKQKPYIITGWLWYTGTLVPVIGIIQVGTQSMADRYTYIPLIGIFIIFAWGIPDLLGKWRYKKLVMTMLATLVLSVLTAITWKQTGYWKNSITIFEHALKVTSDNDIAHFNLGLASFENGDMDKAIFHYLKAYEIQPQYVDTFFNLARAYEKQGDHDQADLYFQKADQQAIRTFSNAASLNPDNPQVQYNLGTAYLRSGDLDKALLHLNKAVSLNSDNDQAQYNLGNAYYKKKDYDNAALSLQKAVDLNPAHENARQLLGSILFQKGMLTEAESHFREVIKSNPQSAQSNFYLGAIALKQKKIEIASRYFQSAVDLEPDNPLFHYQLGEVCQSQNLGDEAIEQYKQTLALNPQSVPAMFNLSILYSKIGKYDIAISYLETIRSLQPDNPSIYYNIACMNGKQHKIEDAQKWLQMAFDKGYANWDQIQKDSDLDCIRNTRAFKQMKENQR